MSRTTAFFTSPLVRSERFLLAAVIVWSSFQFYILGKYSIVIMGDEGDSTISGLMSVPHVKGAFSLWSPFAALGTDRLALGYNPPFLTLLFDVLPSWLAYAGAHTAMIAIGIIGVFLICRQRFQMTVAAAIFAALLYGNVLAFDRLWLFSVAITPLCLLALSRLLDDRGDRRRWFWAAVAAISFSLTGSIAFLVIFPAIFFALWYLFLERRYHWKDWLIIIGFFVVAYLLRWQEILALVFNAGLSPRADWVLPNQELGDAMGDAVKAIVASFSPAAILPIFQKGYPDYSTMALYSFLVMAVLTKARTPGVGRLLTLFVASLLVGHFLPVVKSLLYDLAPLLHGLSFGKFFVYTPLIVFIGAGFAFQALSSWVRDKSAWTETKRRWIIASPFVVILSIGLVEKTYFFGYSWITQGSYTHLYGSPVLQKLAKRIEADQSRSRVASFQMYDVIVHAYGLESGGGNLSIYPKRYNQFWSKMVEPAMARLPSETLHFDTLGIMELGLSYKQPDKKPVRSIGDLYRLNMFALANVRYFISRDRLTDPQFRELDFEKPEAPWSSLSPKQKILANLKDNFSGKTSLYVYENTEALPRFFLAESISAAAGRDQALKQIASSTVKELGARVIADRNDLPSGLNIDERFSSTGKVTVVDYGDDRIELDVSLEGASLLVVANSYSPYWKAFVDGKEVDIFPAYVALWGVRLPATAKTVIFKYDPPYRI